MYRTQTIDYEHEVSIDGMTESLAIAPTEII